MIDLTKHTPWSWAILAVAILTTSCAHSPAPENDAVATWREGTISSTEFSSWLTFQGKTPTNVDSAAACHDLLLVSTLASETEDLGIDTKTSNAIDNAIDSILVKHLRRHMASQITISEAQIEAAFKKFPDAFQKPRKWRLRNLFLSYPPEASEAEKEAVRLHMKELQEQLGDGVNFGDLAEQESDSQTRFRKGLMGNIASGQLPEPINTIAMGLNPGDFSSPIETPDGVTLLMCDQIIEPKNPTSAEIRSNFEKNLKNIEEKRRWNALTAELGGDGTSDLTFRGKAADRARTLGLDQDSETTARTTWTRRQILATEALRRRVESAFEPPSDDDIRKFYEQDPSAFRSSETFEISVINLEGGDDIRSTQSLAFRLSYQLRRNQLDFGKTAETFSKDPSAPQGGRLEIMIRRQLAGRGPEFMKTITGLGIGEISRNFTANGSVWIVRLDARHAGKTMTFDQAFEKAQASLTQKHVAALQESIETDILAGLDVVVLNQ